MNKQQFINRISQYVVMAILIASTTAFAQGQRDGRQPRELPDAERIEKMVENLTEKLSLSEDQKVKIQDLYTSHYEKVAELRETYGDDRETQRAERKNLRSELEESITALITDEQNTAYEELKKERSTKRKKRR